MDKQTKRDIKRIKHAIHKAIRHDFSFINESIKSIDRLIVYCDSNDDFRNGLDTYGYDSIQSTMEYIEDRFIAYARLVWLRDGINGGYFNDK